MRLKSAWVYAERLSVSNLLGLGVVRSLLWWLADRNIRRHAIEELFKRRMIHEGERPRGPSDPDRLTAIVTPSPAEQEPAMPTNRSATGTGR